MLVRPTSGVRMATYLLLALLSLTVGVTVAIVMEWSLSTSIVIGIVFYVAAILIGDEL